MDFDSLQIFKAVVDAGGIIAAARQLHRVQSGVTTRIKQLEASLGVELFMRDQRRLRLSPAGEIFLGYVEQILHLTAQARYAVLGDTPRGVLRLGTLESTAPVDCPHSWRAITSSTRPCAWNWQQARRTPCSRG